MELALQKLIKTEPVKQVTKGKPTAERSTKDTVFRQDVQLVWGGISL